MLPTETAAEITIVYASIQVDVLNFIAIAVQTECSGPIRTTAIGAHNSHGELAAIALGDITPERNLDIVSADRYRGLSTSRVNPSTGNSQGAAIVIIPPSRCVDTNPRHIDGWTTSTAATSLASVAILAKVDDIHPIVDDTITVASSDGPIYARASIVDTLHVGEDVALIHAKPVGRLLLAAILVTAIWLCGQSNGKK